MYSSEFVRDFNSSPWPKIHLHLLEEIIQDDACSYYFTRLIKLPLPSELGHVGGSAVKIDDIEFHSNFSIEGTS